MNNNRIQLDVSHNFPVAETKMKNFLWPCGGISLQHASSRGQQ